MALTLPSQFRRTPSTLASNSLLSFVRRGSVTWKPWRDRDQKPLTSEECIVIEVRKAISAMLTICSSSMAFVPTIVAPPRGDWGDRAMLVMDGRGLEPWCDAPAGVLGV